jgi:tetratricopeptide (TPR) repeat protein
MKPIAAVRLAALLGVLHWVTGPALHGTVVLGAETVVRRGGKNVSGDVSEISKTEVVVKTKGAKEETVTIPANEVVSIAWTGEAPEAGLARSDDNAGRYAKAIEGFQKSITGSKSTNPAAKSDLEFGIARATARLALADPAQLSAAVKLLEDFKGRDHYRHYEAVDLLGELYLAQKDLSKATSAFETYGRAPWKDCKMKSKVQLARLKLVDGKLDDALQLYEAVAGETADGAAEVAQKQEGQLGKARVLLARQMPAEALALLNEVIAAADPDEVSLHAEAFLRQGDCLRELGKDKDAVLAYLRVDTLFSAAKAQHAEALFQLAKLWGKVGRPERGDETRDRLSETYPNSEWAAKLKAAG